MFLAKMTFSLAIAASTCSAAPVIGELYGVDADGGEVVRISVVTGAASQVSSIGFTPSGLAFDQNQQAVVMRSDSWFASLDVETGATGSFTRISENGVRGLDFSLNYAEALTVTSSDQLLSVDPGNGAATRVDSVLGFNFGTSGIALNRSNGNLYAVSPGGEIAEFVAGTTVPVFGRPYLSFVGTQESGLSAIATDGLNRLFGVGLDSDHLFLIDPATRVATSIGYLGDSFGDIRGLAFVVPAPGSVGALVAFGGLARRRR